MDGNREAFNQFLQEAREPLVAAMRLYYDTPEHVRKEMQQDYELYITELVTLENEVRD